MVDSISWDELIEQAGDTVVTSFEPLPNDEYELEVVEAEYKKATTGKDMWKVQVKVVDGQFKNRRIFDNIVLDPANLNFFFRKMGALGLTVDYFKSKPSNDAVSAALNGRRFRGKIAQKPYNGEIQNEIKQYMPSKAGAVPDLPTGAAPVSTPPPAAVTPPPAASPAPSPSPAPAASTPPPPNLPF